MTAIGEASVTGVTASVAESIAFETALVSFFVARARKLLPSQQGIAWSEVVSADSIAVGNLCIPSHHFLKKKALFKSKSQAESLINHLKSGRLEAPADLAWTIIPY